MTVLSVGLGNSAAPTTSYLLRPTLPSHACPWSSQGFHCHSFRPHPKSWPSSPAPQVHENVTGNLGVARAKRPKIIAKPVNRSLIREKTSGSTTGPLPFGPESLPPGIYGPLTQAEAIWALPAGCERIALPRYGAGAGCEIPAKTPDANLRAFAEFAASAS